MSWRAFLPKMLWLNRRFGHRKVGLRRAGYFRRRCAGGILRAVRGRDDDVATVRDDTATIAVDRHITAVTLNGAAG